MSLLLILDIDAFVLLMLFFLENKDLDSDLLILLEDEEFILMVVVVFCIPLDE